MIAVSYATVCKQRKCFALVSFHPILQWHDLFAEEIEIKNIPIFDHSIMEGKISNFPAQLYFCTFWVSKDG